MCPAITDRGCTRIGPKDFKRPAGLTRLPINVYGGMTGHPAYADTAVEDGAGLAASTYTSHLNQFADAAGATVEFQYTGQTTAPDQAEHVAEVRSAPLGRQLEYAMKQSNNMLFEMFGREAALAAGTAPDFTGSTRATMATLDQLGVDTAASFR